MLYRFVVCHDAEWVSNRFVLWLMGLWAHGLMLKYMPYVVQLGWLTIGWGGKSNACEILFYFCVIYDEGVTAHSARYDLDKILAQVNSSNSSENKTCWCSPICESFFNHFLSVHKKNEWNMRFYSFNCSVLSIYLSIYLHLMAFSTFIWQHKQFLKSPVGP